MYDHADREGWYCETCDKSYPDDDFETVVVDEYYQRFKCPHCGYVHPPIHVTDYGYAFREYLLFGSNWYEGTFGSFGGYP